MDACGPNPREEEQEDMGQIVDRDEEEPSHIRWGLEHAIERIEGNGSPWREGLMLVVLVMQAMDILVQELVGVKSAMHPIDSNLKEDHVEGEVEQIELEAAHIREIEIDTSVVILNKKLWDDREASIDEDRRLSKKNLIKDDWGLWVGSAFALEESLAKEIVDGDVPQACSDPIDTSTSNKITKIRHSIVTCVRIKTTVHDLLNERLGKDQRVD
jgi:hypothetical protein